MPYNSNSVLVGALIVGAFILLIRMLLRRRAASRQVELAKPRVVRIADQEICDFWQEDGDYEPGDEEFGGSADKRWFATYDVYLVDDQGCAVGGMGWAGLDSFLMHYPVCSPALKRDAPADLADELNCALVQPRFDEAKAFDQLKSDLARLPSLPAPELVQALKQWLYFLPKGV